MFNKKKIVALGLASLLLLAGCGKDSDTNDKETKSNVTSNQAFSEEKPLRIGEDLSKNDRTWFIVEVDGDTGFVSKDSYIKNVLTVKDKKIQNVEAHKFLTEEEAQDQLSYYKLKDLRDFKSTDAFIEQNIKDNEKIWKQEIAKRTKPFAQTQENLGYNDEEWAVYEKNEKRKRELYKTVKYLPPQFLRYRIFLDTDDSGNNVAREGIAIHETTNEMPSAETADQLEKYIKELNEDESVHDDYTSYTLAVFNAFEIYDDAYAGYYLYRSGDLKGALITKTDKDNVAKIVTGLDDLDLEGAIIDQD